MVMEKLKDPIFFIPFITILIFLAPIFIGLAFVLSGALGFSAVIALPEALQSKLPLWAFFDMPNIGNSIIFTVIIGFTATIIAWGVNISFLALAQGTRLFRYCQSFLSPILATPHITLAVGLIFLVAPSGIIARLLAPFFGWQEPPFWNSNPDPYGILLVIGLVIKELPFLFLLSLSSLERINYRKLLQNGQVLGYHPVACFAKLVYPQLYSQMRLPLFVVLAFSLAIVDMALILAPNAPMLLGVTILNWARDPNLEMQFFASAAALWMFIITVASIGFWWLFGKICAPAYRIFICSGWRGNIFNSRLPHYFINAIIIALIALTAGAILMLVIWSFSGLWQFPQFIPDNLSLKYWGRALLLMRHAFVLTLFIALVATLISMVLAIGCLEAEKRYGFKPNKMGIWILYCPLLMPQISFLFGVQILLIKLGLIGTLPMVIFGHVIFVLPYIYLSLAGPWHKLSDQYRFSAASIGKSPSYTLFRLILPLQLSSLLTALSLGVAVSVALYLPTYLLGSGNVTTLTSEAIVLSSGGNRRIVSVYGLVQASLPLLFFTIALYVPRLLYKNRKDMDVRT